MPKKEKYPTARPFLPPKKNLASLTSAVQSCRGCPLYKYATQAVFGEGRSSAKLIFVGEQPGDLEDRKGRPFIGPAGLLLDKALTRAGIDRKKIYVTNAVKHFKFREEGKRRLHERPRGVEIKACRPWLEEEIKVLKPKMIVCLGATAASSIMKQNFKIGENRGKVFKQAEGLAVFISVHPSSILRARDSESREAQFSAFVSDLKKLKKILEKD